MRRSAWLKRVLDGFDLRDADTVPAYTDDLPKYTIPEVLVDNLTDAIVTWAKLEQYSLWTPSVPNPQLPQHISDCVHALQFVEPFDCEEPECANTLSFASGLFLGLLGAAVREQIILVSNVTSVMTLAVRFFLPSGNESPSISFLDAATRIPFALASRAMSAEDVWIESILIDVPEANRGHLAVIQLNANTDPSNLFGCLELHQ